LLADPQTNGGLLIAVDPAALEDVQEILCNSGLQQYQNPIGQIIAAAESLVFVK